MSAKTLTHTPSCSPAHVCLCSSSYLFSRRHATLHLEVSVGLSQTLNCKQFLHYGPSPTICDYLAVYPVGVTDSTLDQAISLNHLSRLLSRMSLFICPCLTVHFVFCLQFFLACELSSKTIASKQRNSAQVPLFVSS